MAQFICQFGDSFSTLVLGALGLAIIYGMMGIINMAHGEFIMVGAMTTATLCAFGVPFPVSVVLAGIFMGLIGLVLDRVIICHLYSRTLDSVVVTWGISMVLKQLAAIWQKNKFGGMMPAVKIPFGNVGIGNVAMPIYKILLIVLAVVAVIIIYFLFNRTKFGLHVRATMQKHDIAESLGVNTNKIYASTFVIGSILAGLAGGLFSPLFSISSDFGSNYMMPSFVTVLVGGANPLIGTVLSGISLSVIQSFITGLWNSLFGNIGMLIAAIIFIRFCPKGLSDLVAKIRQKREQKKVITDRR